MSADVQRRDVQRARVLGVITAAGVLAVAAAPFAGQQPAAKPNVAQIEKVQDNLFMVTGPGSPSVLSNMIVSIEQHVDWIVDRLVAMRDAGFTTIEATETAQAGWARHMADCSMLSLHRLANTWYTGANVPGKARWEVTARPAVGSGTRASRSPGRACSDRGG